MEFTKKKCIIAGIITSLFVVMVVFVTMITWSILQMKTTIETVQEVCAPTKFKDTCVNSYMTASLNSTQPQDLIKLSFKINIRAIEDGIKKSSTDLNAEDKETKEVLELCEMLMNDAAEDLKKCFDNFEGFSNTQNGHFVEDLRVWLSGSIAYQQTCMDIFGEIKSNLSQDMHKIFRASKELTSNSLAMITNHVENFNIKGSTGDLGDYTRKLLSMEDSIPSWVGPNTGQLMIAQGGVKADVVVAKDGSGHYKSIKEALTVVPQKNQKPFVIYIKQGVYNEIFNVTKKMTHVTFIGDGPTKTKITGSLNRGIGNLKTYLTATVGIDGEHFTAKNMGFENTAGPQGNQAVALRVSGDLAVFHNCQIDGYQDTLYVHAHRQFFRDCTISGTIDFIFGDAKAILQNCKIIVRKPMKSQSCMITAQGRTNGNETTGIVLHNCHIIGDPEYIPVKSVNKAYLGRPWREFSRTIIMRTTIDNVIDPAGWSPFCGNRGLNTLYYSEYENNGPGSNQTQRVKWPGIKKLSLKQALQYTPARFLKGNLWIPQTHVPYTPNLQ